MDTEFGSTMETVPGGPNTIFAAATPSDAKIVAVVNELGANPNADQFLVYEAINVP
ncbi:MAG: hypothetical protein R3A44_33725 [Caldilineaceae bacterium]